MSSRSSLRYSRGMTLIELMIVIIILAVVIAIAAPSFTQVIKTNRMRTETNKLVAALNYAKSEAVKRNTVVTLCASSTGNSCTGNLQEGWLIHTGTPASPLRVSEGLASRYTITNNVGVPATGNIAFSPDGSTPDDQILLVCAPDKKIEDAWSVTLTTVGKPMIRVGITSEGGVDWKCVP